MTTTLSLLSLAVGTVSLIVALMRSRMKIEWIVKLILVLQVLTVLALMGTALAGLDG